MVQSTVGAYLLRQAHQLPASPRRCIFQTHSSHLNTTTIGASSGKLLRSTHEIMQASKYLLAVVECLISCSDVFISGSILLVFFLDHRKATSLPYAFFSQFVPIS